MRKFLIIALLCLPFSGNATHLVGGCIQLLWKGGDQYTLKVYILRDCENGNPGAYFDNPIAVGIFEKVTNIKKAQFSLNFSPANDDTLKFTGDNCANIITGCTHIATYTANITLNSNTYNSNNGYYLSWQRCCRNGIIANIINPGDAAMTLYTEVPNLKTVKNSTPRYTSNPVTLMCANNLFEYNMNFVDDDGDELRYSIIDPINGHLDKNQPSSNTATPGPYPNTVWRNGYSNSGTILGSVPLSIDPGTGLIRCNPSSPGVYVASIRVEEYRFGIKIGEVRLELQFTVTTCPNNPPVSAVTSKDGQIITGDTIFVTIPEQLCFKVRGMDQSDSVYLYIYCDSLDSTLTHRPIFDSVSAGRMVTETNICWQTDCELDKVKHAVPFRVYARDNGCPISRNSEGMFWVRILPMPLVNSTDLLCMNLVNNRETTVYFGDSTDINDPYFDKYIVYRGINYQNYQPIDTIFQKGLRQFTDPNTPNYSRINYTYFMRGMNKCGYMGPTSDTLSTFEQLEFLPQKQVLKYVTVVDNDHLEMEWPATTEKDFAKYFLYRGTRNKNNFKLVATFENANDTRYQDYDVTVSDTSYCYYLIMKDTCDNLSPVGYSSCSMVIRGTAADFISRLNWDSYLGWREGVEFYTLHRSDPANPFSIIAQTDSVYKYNDSKLNLNEGLFFYYVEAKQAFSEAVSPFFDATSRSNTIQLYQSPIVYAPNAYTRNGDGLNDDFKWVPVFVKDFHIEIYNRWGDRIYESNDKLKPWDGTVNGKQVQEDVYFYIIRYTGWEGSDKAMSGNFTILR